MLRVGPLSVEGGGAMGASVAGPRASVCMRVRGEWVGFEAGSAEGSEVGSASVDDCCAPAVVSASSSPPSSFCGCWDGCDVSGSAADLSVLSSTGDVEVSIVASASAPCGDVAIVVHTVSLQTGCSPLKAQSKHLGLVPRYDDGCQWT